MTARRTGIASVAALAALTLTVGGVHAVAPDLARELGLDVWTAPSAEAAARQAAERGRLLRDHADRVTRQIADGDSVGVALAAGRMTLADAVVVLAEVNATRVGFLDTLRRVHPDAESDRELVARYAMGKAWVQLEEEPATRAEVVRRLAPEFAALVGKTWSPAE